MAVYTDIDGNVYNSVIIGNQEWIIENFKAIHYSDGSDIPLITDPAQWVVCGKSIIDPESECASFGTLYNWFATSKNGGTGVGSIAPTGFHVPTAAEWFDLKTFIDPDGLYNNNYVGAALKENDSAYWIDTIVGYNEYGFNSRGSGQRIVSDYGTYKVADYVGIKEWVSYACSDQMGALIQWHINTTHDGETLNVPDSGVGTGGDKLDGLSVRCLMDVPGDWYEGYTVTDIDGNIYNTCQIGSQVWITSDLAVSQFNDGTTIPLIADADSWVLLTSEAMCYYNNETCMQYKDAYCWYNNLR